MPGVAGRVARDIKQVDDPAARRLLERATAAGFRPLLVRGDRRRVLLTDASPPGATTTIVERWDDLALPGPGQRRCRASRSTGPLLLVCAHEQRDPCCGLDGQALLDALAGPDVFACSHLGGHRFAPTAMVLPTGYVYGHLDASSPRGPRTGGGVGGRGRPLPGAVHVVSRAGRSPSWPCGPPPVCARPTTSS